MDTGVFTISAPLQTFLTLFVFYLSFSLCKSLLLYQGSKQKQITIFMSPPMTNESRSKRKNKTHSLLHVHRILIILSTAIIFSIPLMLLLHPHNFDFHSIFALLSVKSPFRSRERTVRVNIMMLMERLNTLY